MWLLAELEGPGATYNNSVAVRLTGDLDTRALAAALADVIERHEVLRTVFPAVDGQPYQLVRPVAELGWELPVTAVADKSLADAVAAVVSQPFDLSARDSRCGPGCWRSVLMSMCSWW